MEAAEYDPSDRDRVGWTTGARALLDVAYHPQSVSHAGAGSSPSKSA